MSTLDTLSQYGKLDEQVMLSAHTTFAIGGPARWFFRPDSRESLPQAMPHIPPDLNILPLGRGSNLLVPDSGFDGLVLDLSSLNAITIETNTLFAEAGARMSKIAQNCASNGLTGLEFMATVPGDMGGGIAMNAGAFKQQVSDHVQHIEILNRQGEISALRRDDLDMAYRQTHLPTGSLVLSATFELANDEPELIRERMRTMRKQRSDTQPLAQPNCGSVFKNPEGDFAARLIEAVGLKGKQIGNARISNTHANFIVNQGNASCDDVLALISTAQRTVQQQFSIQLEPEVRFLGNWS
ncbi:MAG: UDP-N-acetylmuramate dehydrogenase [Mariprofundaceae bacterium]